MRDFLSQGLALNETMATMIKQMLYRPVTIVKVARIIVLALGIMLIVSGFYAVYKRSGQTIDENSSMSDKKTGITQVSPAY